MFNAREEPTTSTHRIVPAFEEGGDNTTVLSVATLRDLVARSAGGKDAPAKDQGIALSPPSKPAFLDKSAPILVMPETERPRRTLAVPRVVARAVPVTRAHTVFSFIRSRVVAMGLLALAVGTQPWWWNIGDVRVAAVRKTRDTIATSASRSPPQRAEP